MRYNPALIEEKWRTYWRENQIYKVDIDDQKPKYYVLDMFPYPSGAGLHVGHPLGYIASDIYARFKRLKGFNVLHPMGYDAFGLPAEQYAIQTGVHPDISTNKNIERYREQLDNIGFSYDWDREIKTCDPNYYKWTQWIFLKLFNHYYDPEDEKPKSIASLVEHFNRSGNTTITATHTFDRSFTAADWANFSPAQKEDVLMNYRLAYRKMTYVNWCEALGTVLANDEVKDGLSERGGHPVEQKPMLQWSLRITAYAERLLNGLETVEFSDSLKSQQKNWIGKSTGAQIFFKIEHAGHKLEIFTTRPDTIFGATFMVLAPEHDLVTELTTSEHQKEIDEYIAYVKSRSEIERMSDVKSVTGAFTGSYAQHPFSGTPIPIWISEYVLKDYGTGAIMAVPSDDERDHRFATKFDLNIIDVIDRSAFPEASMEAKVGHLINSDFLNGLDIPSAIERAIDALEAGGIGSGKVNYKLRDAIFSRQRYWGEPFPILYDEQGLTHELKESELPLTLPDLDDFKPAAEGKSPLARLTDWIHLPNGMTRETDTMPGYAGSSWYFLRYMDPNNESAFASEEALSYWRDVDLYVGGTEHAVGHLLYSRFWHKFLHDKGLVPTDEPYKKLINQGKIQGIISYLYLQKEKENGYQKFVCAGLVGQRPDVEFVKIPVHIDFVRNYGASDAFINIESIKQMIDWRPAFKDAIFECSKGVYHLGAFNGKGTEDNSHLFTGNELGKMSKSLFNVINPDRVVEAYGADTFRLYEMFLGPVEQDKPWDTKGIDGVNKFLRKYWNLVHNDEGQWKLSEDEATREELKILHLTIKKVQEDIERFSFNTAVSAMMVCVNELRKLKCCKRQIIEPLSIILAAFAPHITEEIWHLLSKDGSIHQSEYPAVDSSILVEDEVEYPVSINGKKRDMLVASADSSNDELQAAALELDKIKKWLEDKQIVKVIVVPKRMINIVVR